MGPVSDHRHLVDVVVDVDDDDLAAALADAFAPHRVHRVTEVVGPGATATLADHAATVVVCAPAGPEPGDGETGRIALRARDWAIAAGVVGARLVLVSSDEVFTTGTADDAAPDEFSCPDRRDAVGRARRAAEAEVAGAGTAGVVVRATVAADPVELAATVHWAVTAAGPGPWHHPDPDGRLDDRHTRAVRAAAHPREPA